jgi:general stress protein 26
MSNTTSTPTTPLSWDDLRATVTGLGSGVYFATTGADGRPHVAWVVPGWADEQLWVATYASSQKAANLRHSPAVAMTCAATPEANVLIRATARLVTEPDEATRLWEGGVMPYDLNNFFQGPTDPETLFVELTPQHASVAPLGPGPVRRWTPAS